MRVSVGLEKSLTSRPRSLYFIQIVGNHRRLLCGDWGVGGFTLDPGLSLPVPGLWRYKPLLCSLYLPLHKTSHSVKMPGGAGLKGLVVGEEGH